MIHHSAGRVTAAVRCSALGANEAAESLPRWHSRTASFLGDSRLLCDQVVVDQGVLCLEPVQSSQSDAQKAGGLMFE